jgi:hypothetical protein
MRDKRLSMCVSSQMRNEMSTPSARPTRSKQASSSEVDDVKIITDCESNFVGRFWCLSIGFENTYEKSTTRREPMTQTSSASANHFVCP